MIILVLGTPDSGKSKKAESLVLEISEKQDRLYVATMIPFGREGKERVEKHRKMREGKGFTTIECPVEVAVLTKRISGISSKTVLLECMSNLVGNEMHSDKNRSLPFDELAKKIVLEVTTLGGSCQNLIVVSNSFDLYDENYDEDTKQYVKLIDDVNKLLKEKADRTYELIEGEWRISENN